MNPSDPQADCEIALSRVFDAPRELVWKVWTEVEHLEQWWGPQGFTTTTTTREREFKPGGMWRYVMHGPDGRDYENISTYLEVSPPERLVYKHGGDADREAVNFHVTVTFEQVGEGQTKVSMRSVFPSKAARDFVIRQYNALEGAKQHLARLGEHLQAIAGAAGPNGRTLEITRVFHVPVERMWSAWTEREQLMEWFGPQGAAIAHGSLELKPGGMFHYCLREADGKDAWGKWTFRKLARPDRLEFLVGFADEKGQMIRAPFDANWPLETLAVVTFAPHAGIGHGTLVRILWSAFNASEAEQKTFDAGRDMMQQGWNGTLDRLAAHLAKA